MTMRRWWVVKCAETPCDLKWLRANREQLIAEAKHALDAGEIPVLPEKVRGAHKKSVVDVHMEHPYEEAVREWSTRKPMGCVMSTAEAVEGAMGRAAISLTMGEMRKFGEVMRMQGWEKRHVERGNKWVKLV
jgi:hypothetical protein